MASQKPVTFEIPPGLTDVSARRTVSDAWGWAASVLEEHCGEIGDDAMRDFVAHTAIPLLLRKSRTAAEDPHIHWWRL